MFDEQVIVAAERLRDDLEELRKSLRRRYSAAARQVTADDLRERATRIAETWLVGVATDREAVAAIGSETVADLSVHFQRLMTFAEHATTRGKYDAEIAHVLKDYTVNIVLRLKQHRGTPVMPSRQQERDRPVIATAFLGQSFADTDKHVNECVSSSLEALGITVVTGERPKADSISEKVKRLIDAQDIFVGLFARRDKVARKNEWTTSPWVIDEKAYALGRQKPLILIKERGVGSIGGIQGDYEFLEFSREELQKLVIKLLQIFDVSNHGLRK